MKTKKAHSNIHGNKAEHIHIQRHISQKHKSYNKLFYTQIAYNYLTDL